MTTPNITYKEQIDRIIVDCTQALLSSSTPQALQDVRVHFLGRKQGVVTQLLKSLKDYSDEDKKIYGPLAQQAREQIERLCDEAEQRLSHDRAQSNLDLTLPGLAQPVGHLHPMTLIMNDLMDIFTSMGFMVFEGPEMDHEFYNFESLNIPKSHPARDIQDTFFIQTPITRKEKRDLPSSGWVMRTHTSNMQVRLMEQYTPPLRCIIPGRVFRNEATDASHEHTFYQLEGFVVDKDISVGHLTWTLREIFRQLYKKDIKVRLRPGYFPFTEPSFEPDMSCVFCDGVGCRVCKYTGWLEMGGSGMIHPAVFKAAGYAEHAYTGFAFGMGISRLAMLKYGLPDVRMFMENDVRVLKQF